jgi:hypothetical protein
MKDEFTFGSRGNAVFKFIEYEVGEVSREDELMVNLPSFSWKIIVSKLRRAFESMVNEWDSG